MKNKSVWFWIGIAAVCVGVAAVVCGIVFEFINRTDLFKIAGITLAVAGPIAIICFIIQLMFFGGANPAPNKNRFAQKPAQPKEPRTVDVKPAPKSQDELMYEKYVELYNKNLITKEELDKKRQELLGN